MKHLSLIILFLLSKTLIQAQFSGSNKVAHFSNAADEGISIPYNNALTFGITQSLTVEAWIKTNDNASCMMIFAHQDCPASGSPGIMLYISGGKAWFYCNLTYATSACAVADNNWHHISGVRNTITDSLYIYIDAVLQAQVLDNSTSPVSTINSINWIGRRTVCGSVCNFYGDIDEVRIWSKAKTANEISAGKDMELAGNETNLVAYYNMNTASNGTGQTVLNNCSNTGAVLNGTNQGNAAEPSYSSAQQQSIFIPCDPVLWLKADAGAYSDAGVTLATNGQTVQQWNDQSGNNKHATQGTAANRPKLITNALNGKPVMRFSTASGFNQLVVPAIDLSVTNKTDLFIVYKINGGNVFFENTADANASTTGFTMYDNPQAGSGASVTLKGDVGYNAIYSHKDCDKYILAEGTFDKSLSTNEVNVRVNGILNPPPTSQPFNSDNTNNFGNNASYIGYRGAGSVNGALPMSGDIAEVILFSRLLTTAERTDVENYLINKYDLNNPGNAVCGPVLWLKADAEVYTDAGITLATDGQAVQQWNDQSGNGNHVTQSTTINKPTYKSPDATARPALYFDGVNKKVFLNNTVSNLVTAGAARTVFVVARRDCNAHAGGVLGGTLFTFRRGGLINTLTYGANSYGTPVYIYSDNNGVGNNNASITGTAIDSAFSPTVVTYKIPAAGSQVQCNLNGVAQTVNQGAGSVTTETGTTGFTVGDREDQVDLDWSGWIYEVIVYNRSLTAAEIIQVENYLKNKYGTGSSAPFTALPAVQTSSNSLFDDGFWKHSYNSSDNSRLIASVKDYCFDLGARSDVVYEDATAGLYNGQRYMRRHYVIKPALNPVSPKRVRLYYTNADFADLQSYIPSLTSASQLVVTKYTGTNEDGVYDPSGGTVLLIPSSQISTGSLYGSNYLEFNVTGFSEFWIHTGNYVLPLTFISFSAYTCNANTVCLNWRTANEQDVSHFEIERSFDGRTFSVIATAAANNQAANNYSLIDDIRSLSVNQKIYYRVKKIDRDNTFSYTNTQLVKLSANGSIDLYPNPASDLVNIIGWNNIKHMWLYDMSGRKLNEWSTARPSIDVKNLSNGAYILKAAVKSGEVVTQRLIINK